MAYSPTYVKELQEKQNRTFWKVYDKTGKYLLDTCENDVGIETSCESLQTTLANIHDDFVKVKLYKNKPERVEKGTTGANIPLEFLVRTGKTSNSQQIQPVLNGLPTWQDVLTMHDKVRQIELEKLKLELEQKEVNSWQERLFNIIESNPAIITGVMSILKTSGASKQNNRIAEPDNIADKNTDITEKFLNDVIQMDDDNKNEAIYKIISAIEQNQDLNSKFQNVYLQYKLKNK